MTVSLHRQPAGAPPFKTKGPAYAELLTSLYLAAQQFENEGDGGIGGAISACRAVARFIAMRHVAPPLAAPFLELAGALKDLQAGKNPELFSPKEAIRTRPRTSRRKHLQTLAAAAMHVLMQKGLDQRAAALKVARAAANWPGFDGPKVSATTIRHWREDQLSASTEERRAFDQICSHLLDMSDPIQEIEKLLARPPGIPKTQK
ncbi:MAG: hypothetical protein ACLP4V_13885 [Methylocella sp.]